MSAKYENSSQMTNNPMPQMTELSYFELNDAPFVYNVESIVSFVLYFFLDSHMRIFKLSAQCIPDCLFYVRCSLRCYCFIHHCVPSMSASTTKPT